MTKPRKSEIANYKVYSTLMSQGTRLPFELRDSHGGVIPEGTPIIKTRLRQEAVDVSIATLLLDLPQLAAAHDEDLQSLDPPQFVVGITEQVCAEKIAQIVAINFTPINELMVPNYMTAEAVLGHANRHQGQIGSLVVAHMTVDNLLEYSSPEGWTQLVGTLSQSDV